MFAERIIWCRSHFACIFSIIVSISMNLGSRRFAIGLWRVESVDAHSHMTCVRLYACHGHKF
jgi:thymidylate synthase